MSTTTNSGTARWQARIDPATTSGANSTAALYAVANVAAIELLDDSQLQNGSAVGMRSVLDTWMLNRDSVEVPDGITVAAALGGGNWVRLMDTAAEWLKRLTWFIDQAAGDDENDGATALTAIATFDELWRRTGFNPAPQAVVTVVGDYTGDVVINNSRSISPAFTSSLVVNGSRAVLYSGSVTAIQNWSVAAQLKQLITDTALPVSWTASGLVGKKIVLTSGANSGAWAQILVDAGGKQAFVGPFVSTSFTVVAPVVTDTFDVVDISEIAGTLNVTGGFVEMHDIRLNSPDNWDCFVSGGAYFLAFGVESAGIASVSVRQAHAAMVGCFFNDSVGHQADSGAGAVLGLWGCAFKGTQPACHGGDVVVNEETVVVSADALGSGILIDDNGFLRVEASAWLAFFDCTGSATVEIHETSRAALGSDVWGSGNACTYFWRIRGGCLVECAAATNLTRLGGVAATNDVLVGTVAAAYAGIPATDAANLAGIVLTA